MLRRLKRAARASLLPVTGIEESKRTGSPYGSLPKYEKDCNTISKARKSVLQFFRLITSLLISAEGTQTPAGVRGRGDPAGA